MKHNIINGKWMPENETFVHVPNEQIPEVIQLLRDNGHPVWANEEQFFQGDENVIWFDHSSEWHSNLEDQVTKHNIELPFPDFKALVTGKLPESWCIQCTEESVKHEAFENLCMVLGLSSDSEFEGKYYGIDKAPRAASKPFGEVLQIETWAALNEADKNYSDFIAPITVDSVLDEGLPVGADVFPDESLIRVLKSRGYTVSKEPEQPFDCPFCGYTAVITDRAGDYIGLHLECTNCLAEMNVGYGTTKSREEAYNELIDNWNQRSTP